MAKEVTIVVASTPMLGKSSIAELIRRTLAKEGFNVFLLDDNGVGDKEFMSPKECDEGVKHIKDKIEVRIRTVQTRRNLSVTNEAES